MSAAQDKAPLKVAVAGLGTVGQGVVRVLARNAELITRRAGRPIRVVAASVRNRSRTRDCPLEGVELHDDPLALAGCDVDVVVELMGGLELAQSLVLAALENGKSVVTANKALLAERGDVVFAAAEKSSGALAFEAAVCGGIPVIKALREGLVANRIDAVIGICNGTSNFILTEMARKGVAFADALADAQRLGYAEADPTFDVEGIDAAHKLTLLASIAFGVRPMFASVYHEGLSRIQARDVQLAQELGYRIKPLAIAKRGATGLELRVHPTLVRNSHLLASVDDSLNAVSIFGDAVGQTVYIGRGAGSEPTASAVIADLVDLARGQISGDPLGQPVGGLHAGTVLPLGEVRSASYLRLRVDDAPGVLRSITAILAELDISVEAILQKEPREAGAATLAIITSVAPEARHAKALEQVLALPFAHADYTRLRVEHFDED
ncbi:MAG: homoserine dehydrogenase [Nevskiaceae bacterium]|nr:MAG: homoserine dehydrogenase [Nevskiaceae bacterium]TBR74719.1 MAG: homoserine dehydrogenase [Nevskiaceae bacterium]